MTDTTRWSSGKTWSAAAAAVIPLLASLALGYFFRPNDWYFALKKPCWMPPGWIFFVAWMILYPLIGVAMVEANYNSTATGWIWILPIMNIILSLMFSPVMFGFHSMVGGAIIVSICLVLGIAIMFQYCYTNHSATATWLMLPYVLWMILANFFAWYILVKNYRGRTTCERDPPVIIRIPDMRCEQISTICKPF